MAKDHTNYYRVKFTAYAELGGEQIDIAGLKATYALDTIPKITVFPTVGRDPSNDKEAEAVQKFLEAKQFTSLKVYANFETELDNPEKDEPGFPYDEDVLVFEGYLAGVTYASSRTAGSGSMRLEAEGIGWLVGLAGSDAHTKGVTLKGAAGWDELTNPSYPGTSIGIMDIQAAIFEAKKGDVVTNLWKSYIKTVFESIVQDKAVWGDVPNEAALNALSKMDEQKAFSGDASNKLELEFGGGSDSTKEFEAEFMTQAVSRRIFDTWRNKGASLWDVLKKLASDFKFRIVPLIETAGCCPVYGALSGEPYRTITANDYYSINIVTNAETLISKYVLISGKDGYSVTRCKTPKSSGLIGLYDMDLGGENEDNVTGQTIVETAPLWIAAESQIGKITRQSLGVKGEGGTVFGIPDASNPDAFSGELEDDYQKLYNDVRTTKLGDNYAQAMAQETNLSPRAGSIGGRFRLDISPGSMIAFEVIDDKFSDADAEPQLMYGTVTHVMFTLDSGRSGPIGNASTEFAMAWVRNKAEHEDELFTYRFHPLWANEKFVGTKLWKE